MATTHLVTGDTPILIKISQGETIKKLKLPLKDLTADVLPKKLTSLLGLPADAKVIYERFSDSAGGYVTLDAANPAVYKTLGRAAKAKLKLRLRASVDNSEGKELPQPKDTTTEEKMIAGAVTNLTTMQNGRKNPGAGIFEFKDARTAGENKVIDTRVPSGSAPVPHSFLVPKPDRTEAMDSLKARFKAMSKELSVRPKPQNPAGLFSGCGPTWSVYCNLCDEVMENEHFHCSSCDGGDYDLCQRCVDSGKHCPGQGHWLVKRYIKNGQVASGTTERLPPKSKTNAVANNTAATVAAATPPVSSVSGTGKMPSIAAAKKNSTDAHVPATQPSASCFAQVETMPGAYVERSSSTIDKGPVDPTRTCNSCIDVLPESMFVTCKDCEDYDLCLRCHTANKHGHHPAHHFDTATPGRLLNAYQQSLAAPGRATRHYAICDGCEKNIQGVRHKCFDCPDFDYCNDCIRAAHLTHSGHRFAPLYEQLSTVNRSAVKHQGIFCDGPACSTNPRQTFITGVRYKCAVCHDRDYCANCEASPNNPHDKSHPLVKISNPIRGLEVTTMDDVRASMEYVSARAPAHAETQKSPEPAVPASSASTVKTVAHTEPSPSRLESGTLLSESNPPAVLPVGKDTPETVTTAAGELRALYVCDTVPDGITVRADTCFTQVWTMRNPGPKPWPAGCSVRFVGGDNMLNVDRERPFSVSALTNATESNVTGREINPGEKVAFKVILKAPDRPGKAISYWRLKTADGVPFGHRLWCDVKISMDPELMNLTAQNLERLQDTPFKSKFEKAMQANNPQASAMRKYKKGEEVDLMQLLTKTKTESDGRPCHREKQIKRNGSTHMAARRAYFQRKVEEMHNAGQDATAQTVISGPSIDAKESMPALVEVKPGPEAVPFGPAIVAPRAKPNVTQSQMIYPTLEKESPASSMHLSGKGKAATVEDEETGHVLSAERSTIEPSDMSTAVEGPQSGEEEAFEDISDEVEVISASETVSDDDDGFMTDEEYDILDASDEETVHSHN